MRVTAPDDVYVPALDRFVGEDEEIDVPAEVGESLVAQGWRSKRRANREVETPSVSPDEENE